MSLIEEIFKRKYLIFSIFGVLTILGILGYFTLPKKLFPDIERPHIVVITKYPGADAENVATYITIPLERRLHTLSLVRRISSVSMDSVSSIDVEFEYGKDINSALVEVINELKKVSLPPGAYPPFVFKKDSSTPPVIVLAVAPKKNSNLSLADIRELAENQLKDELLKLPHVRNVDIFGGYQKEIEITLNLTTLKKYGLTVKEILDYLSFNNRNIPIGILIDKKNQLTLKLEGQAERIEDFKKMYITPFLKLSDIAQIKVGYSEDFKSLFYSNGRPAIALAVQRLENGDYLKTINEVENLIPKLKKEYPEIDIWIADSMKGITERSFYNMLEVLRDAVIFTLVVMFLFLANTRLTLGVIFSIPLVFVGSVGIMRLLNLEFNIVSETGLILALGMLADDAVVVLENIERHLHQLKEDVKTAIIRGTQEVMFAVAGGSLAITVILLPLLFVGGYAGKVFHFLVSTLIIAIWVSWFVSITFLPMFAYFIYRKGKNGRNFLDSLIEKYIIPIIVEPFKNFYVALVENFLKHPKVIPLYLIFIVALFILSVRLVIPVLGKDTMPPMDTGVLTGTIKLSSEISSHQVKEIAKKINEILEKEKKYGLKRYFIAFGTEAGVITVGGGGNLQSARIVLTYVDRFHRNETIWDIEHRLIKKLSSIEGIKLLSLVAQGSTPLSSIKGTVDTLILSEEPSKLYQYGEKLYNLYYKIKGASSVSLSWTKDNLEIIFIPDWKKMSYYGVSLFQIAKELSTAINGAISSFYTIPNENPLPVIVRISPKDRKNLEDLKRVYIKTIHGDYIPITELGELKIEPKAPIITREDLKYSIEVIVNKDTAPSSFIIAQAHKINQKFEKQLPYGYEIKDKGEFRTMKEALTKMAIAFIIGAILSYFVLVIAFESITAPLAIILSIPLAFMGSMWFLLYAHMHRCAPAMMGLILVSGIIIRNAILLIDFAKEYLEKYGDIYKALILAVRIRTRPVLMTAFATIAGLIPIAMQKAVGLERLGPLATVAIGGLLVGTFLTLVYVPLFFYLFTKFQQNNPTETSKEV